MQTKLKPILSSMAILGIISTPVAAETKAGMLDKMVISATKNEQRAGDIDSTVSVQNESDIKERIVTSVEDLFDNSPSTTVTKGRDSSINVRGIEGNRILITVDGVKQPKALSYGGLSTSRNYIDINTLKMVEVIPTPSSSLYGSGSVGGVVAYTTKEPSDYLDDENDNFGAQLNLQKNSSDDSFSKSIGLAGRIGKAEAMLIISGVDGSEIKNKGDNATKGAPFDQSKPAEISDRNILGKVNIPLNTATQLKLTAENLTSTTFTDDRSNSSFAYSTFDDENKKQRISAEIIHANNHMLFDEVSAKLDYQNSESESLWEYNSRGADQTYLGLYDEQYRAFNLAFKKQFQPDSGLKHNINYGLGIERNNFAQNKDSSTSGISRGMPKAEESTLALYFQDQIQVNNKLTITPGVRFDRYDIDAKPDADYLANSAISDPDPDNNKNQQTSLKLGATYDFTPSHAVFAQFAQGFKAPDMNELFENAYLDYTRFGMGIREIVANPDLKPESSNSYELGYRFNGMNASAEIVAFHNDYNNFIEDNTTYNPAIDTYTTQKQNLNDTQINGLEFKGEYFITNAVTLSGSIAYAKGRYKNQAGETTPLNSVSPVNATVSASYDSIDDWGSKLTIRASADKAKSDMEDPTEFQAKGYAIADLTGYYYINNNVLINAGVFNLFDKTYYDWQNVRDQVASSSAGSGAARYFKVGLTVDF